MQPLQPSQALSDLSIREILHRQYPAIIILRPDRRTLFRRLNNWQQSVLGGQILCIQK